MLFNSIDFAIFLPIVFILYWFVTNKKLKLQNLLIVVASYVFYGWWDWRFLILIFISSLCDFLLGMKIDQADNQKNKKRLLWLSIFINLSLLGFFKYYNFFTDSFIALFESVGITINKGTLVVILPVGISFYTFQTLSYTIDIYRGKLKSVKDFISFFAFISFFPQLVAGPIERAVDLLPQFLKERKFDYQLAVSGLRMAFWGLFKKVVIADNLSKYVDVVYSSPDEFYGLSILIATLLFTFQVYCDFSGYSDMAIGIARLFNFKLMTNFRTPLFSRSMKEFWSRWHISLSTWFRDYVYFPLGGSKEGDRKWAINIFITFLISGLWHGASWAFAIWGIFNGLYLIIGKFTEDFRMKLIRIVRIDRSAILLRFVQTGTTFFLFAFSLITFRAESGTDAWTLITHLPQKIGTQLFDLGILTSIFQQIFPSSLLFIYTMLSLGIFLIVDLLISTRGIEAAIKHLSKPVRVSIYYFLIIWFLLFGAFSEPLTFVYFQF